MVERLLSMQEAQGSIPCSSTFLLPSPAADRVESKADRILLVGATCMPTVRSIDNKEDLCCWAEVRGEQDRAVPAKFHNQLVGGKKDHCLDRGSNTGPLDLQSNALPTELSKQLYWWSQEFRSGTGWPADSLVSCKPPSPPLMVALLSRGGIV